MGEGRGFEISQVRLGPGRIHHCMRTIGKAEAALEMMIRRGLSREAFGQPLIKLGKNPEVVSRARYDIEQMRLMVLKAAKAMDVLGNREARVWVAMVKSMIPEITCRIIDEAIQVHGATGISQWTPLAELYADVRHLRFADGPDEVHHMVVSRAERSRSISRGRTSAEARGRGIEQRQGHYGPAFVFCGGSRSRGRQSSARSNATSLCPRPYG